jgi:hypothetical protein
MTRKLTVPPKALITSRAHWEISLLTTVFRPFSCVHKRLDARYKEETGFKSPYEVIVAGHELPPFPPDYKSCHMIAGTKRWPSKPPPGPWYKRIPSIAYDYFKKTLHIVDTVTPNDHPARVEAEAQLNEISTTLKDCIGMAPIDWRAPHAMPENHPSALATAPHPQPIDGVPPPGPPDVGWFWPAKSKESQLRLAC